MTQISVMVPDDVIRTSFERLLTHFGFDAVCRVECAPRRGADVLWLQDGDADIAFRAPLRAGAVLDRIVTRIAAQEADITIPIGRYVLQAAHSVLMNGDIAVKVTDTEKRLLLALYNAGGKAVSRDALLQQVWGMRPDLDTHTVETHIYRLRQKIEVDPAKPLIVLTKDDGYALQASR